jgi:hypothetical protein
VEVVNAGVVGYSPFNELYYYLNEGRRFEPDVVLVVFVMNDVANPRLHWGYTGELIRDIPDEAIPNLAYDRDHILPILEAKRKRSPLMQFELYRYARSRLDRARLKADRYSLHKGRKWPTYITGEDTIPIQVLLDHDSPEWQWLRSMYDQMHRAFASDDARFVLVVFPLAYQLNESYPYIPQRLVHSYCKENSIPCLDLLPRFQRSSAEELYVGLNSGRTDIWHPTQAGHEVVAAELEAFLVKLDLLGPSLQQTAIP